ncbi:MAG: hypothetical protein WC506_00630 [Candidatus Micrarchaeia archaeon]
MENVNIGIFDTAKTYAGHLGKKGSATDYVIYNYKGPESYLCAYEPSSFPDKLAPLFYCASMTDYNVLVPRAVSKELGEMIVVLDLLGKKPYVDASEIGEDVFLSLVKGTRIEKYEAAPAEGPDAKDFFASLKPQRQGPGLFIPVDSSFMVKSVGTVALGTVMGSAIAIHEELEILPSGKRFSARSFQVHDQDVKEAGVGSRIGIALKGVEVEDVGRGSVIAPPGSIACAASFDIEFEKSRFFATELKAGETVAASIGMNYFTVRIKSIEAAGAKQKLSLETVTGDKVALPPMPVFIAKPEARMRIAGIGKVIGTKQ